MTLLERRTKEAEETRWRGLLRRDMDEEQRKPRLAWALVPTMEQWRQLRKSRIPVGDGRFV